MSSWLPTTKPVTTVEGRDYVIEAAATGNEVDREIEATIEDKQEMGDLNHDWDNLYKNMLGLYTRNGYAWSTFASLKATSHREGTSLGE